LDRELFVQNIERYCALAGIKPTNACKDSGVGSSFLTDIKRGQTPSVGKVQQLAQYLGVTTSELLGEVSSPADISAPAMQFVKLYMSLPAAIREQVVAAMLAAKEHLKNSSKIDFVIDLATGSGGFVTQTLHTEAAAGADAEPTAPRKEKVSSLSSKK